MKLPPISGLEKRVREIAEQRPDVRYPHTQCFYSRGKCLDESTGCLIGQALADLGVDMAALNKLEEDATYGVHDLYREHSDDPLTGDFTWLKRVQTNQDRGETWGECVKWADAQKSPHPVGS